MDLGPLPGQLIEAGNGMMLILFGCMLASAGLYFIKQIRAAYADLGNAATLQHVFARVYLQSKPSAAAAILFFGLFVRTYIVWHARHVESHGLPPGVLEDAAPWLLASSAIPIIWGGICWMRAVLPLRFWSGTWMLVALSSIAFGVWMAF